MKTILVQPQANCASESKLALICKHRGWKIVHDGEADLKVWLSDEPQYDRAFIRPSKLMLIDRRLFINRRLHAITKQTVNDVHVPVFGYGVGVDPETHDGPCVRKRLDHGTHGKVIQCPEKRQRGFCYQKLLTNSPGDTMEEFRLDIYGPEILNTLKYLQKDAVGFPPAKRQNASFDFNVGLGMFSPEEVNCLRRFSMIIGLGFGSLDVIRHRDGLLYVIDATTNTAAPTISWYRNTTMEHYLAVSAAYFERGLLG